MDKIDNTILSERTKNLVKSLNSIDEEHVHVYIENAIRVSVEVSDTLTVEWRFVMEKNWNIPAKINDSPVQLSIPYSVQVFCLNDEDVHEYYKWNNLRIGIKKWIDHLLLIFNQSRIRDICFEERCDQYDVELLRNILDDYEKIWITSRCPNSYAQQILNTFFPVKKLALDENPFEKFEDIHNLFAQNFDHLKCLNLFFAYWPRFGLDDLLLISSSSIDFSNSTLSNKGLNGFIKHWINGSNPRMKYLKIHVSGLFVGGRMLFETCDEDVILKGVTYTIAPSDDKRVYEPPFESIREEIRGIFDFQRKDGTNATIVIKKFEIDMYVWN